VQALEALAGVDAVVFDKTGTLTRDAFALRQLRASEDMGETQALALAAQMARGSLHPVARALAAQAEKAGLAVLQEPLPGWREVAGQGIEAGGFRLGSARFCGVAGGGVGFGDVLQDGVRLGHGAAAADVQRRHHAERVDFFVCGVGVIDFLHFVVGVRPFEGDPAARAQVPGA